MSEKRIVVAGFHHETNTFAPGPTPLEEFEKDDGWPGLVRGDEVVRSIEPLNLALAGFISHARTAGWELLPVLWSNAEPYGRVTRHAYETIAGEIVAAVSSFHSTANGIDAIYLDLHGAMVPEHYDDGEGELLRRLREVVGPTLPIVVSLDLHANLTPQMFALADGITIFRTYPHVDMATTGSRCAELLATLLHTGKPLGKSYRQIPFLLPLCSQHTGSAPCDVIYQQVAAVSTAADNHLVSADFACGFPPADIEHCGAALVCYGEQDDCDACVDQLLQQVVEARPLFDQPLLDADDAVRLAIRVGETGRPAVIADAQDNPGAGGSSDTTGLLEALVRIEAQQAILGLMFDRVTAATAHQVGEGGEFDALIGGNNGPTGVEPFACRVRVVALSDGFFTCTGPMMIGTQAKLGPMARLLVLDRAGSTEVVVSSERSQCLDQAMFRVVGVEPKDRRIVAVKSSVHFRNDFESIASEVIVAACPGANPCRLGDIPYTRLRAEVMPVRADAG